MDKKDKREKEDATKYGEFIPSYFTWITPDEQKKTVRNLENMTDKNKKNNK